MDDVAGLVPAAQLYPHSLPMAGWEQREHSTLEATGGVGDNSYLQAHTRTFATERIKLVQL